MLVFNCSAIISQVSQHTSPQLIEQLMWQQHRFTAGKHSLKTATGPPSGDPMLLLHGVLRCWQDYLPLLPSLSHFWQVHALDFRGHGQSTWVDGQYRVVNYAQDAVAALRSIGRPTVVYGHSLGAMVAAAAAAECPELVRAVVLEDPPFETLGKRIGETSFHRYFKDVREIARRGGSADQLFEQLCELRIVTPGDGQGIRLADLRDATSIRFSATCLTNVDPKLLDPLVDGTWLDGYDLPSILNKMRCPVLLLQGDTASGGMLYDEDAVRLQRELANCTRIRFPGVGHLIHWTETEATLRYLSGFLGSLLIAGDRIAQHDSARPASDRVSASDRVPADDSADNRTDMSPTAGRFKWDPAHEDGHRLHDHQKRTAS
jgi:pimeloyl-ACP methyl ester carboxylesterase